MDCIFLDLSQAAIVACHVHVSQNFRSVAFARLLTLCLVGPTKQSNDILVK